MSTPPRRADLGFGDALSDLDSFTPSPPKAKAKVETARKAAEASGFQSREPRQTTSPKPKAQPRRRRTGRNAQLNIKAKPETIEAFYKIADDHGWGLGETLEHAIKALGSVEIQDSKIT